MRDCLRRYDVARPELRSIAGDRVIMNGWIVCGTWEVVLESGMADDDLEVFMKRFQNGRVVMIWERVRFRNSGGCCLLYTSPSPRD